MRTPRRSARLGLMSLLTAVALTGTAAPPAGAVSLPGNFQPRASFNDPANETVVAGDWSVERTLDARDGNGLALSLTPGQRYRVTVAGTWSYWADAPQPWLADAECSIETTGQYSGDPTTWVTHRWQAMYGHDYLDVKTSHLADDGAIVISELAWEPVSPYTDPAVGQSRCSTDHAYTTTLTPVTGSVGLFVDDRHGWPDNAGTLTVTVSGPAPVFPQIYPCPKWTEQAPDWGFHHGTVGVIDHATVPVDTRRAPNEVPEPAAPGPDGEPLVESWEQAGHFGIYTCNWVVPDATYLIEVEGTYRWGDDPGLVADAECASMPDDPQMRADRFVEDGDVPRDWLDLYIDLERVDWVPMGRIDPEDPRCSLDHRYCILFTPDFGGPLNLKVYDLVYAEYDNVGVLDVEISRVS